MNTVQKFPISVCDRMELEMPRDATLLHVAIVKARPCLWALVDESKPRVLRRFRLTATAEPIPDHLPHWKFVGSVVFGANDCHLWDLGELSGQA
jgi:hypothetical protein